MTSWLSGWGSSSSEAPTPARAQGSLPPYADPNAPPDTDSLASPTAPYAQPDDSPVSPQQAAYPASGSQTLDRPRPGAAAPPAEPAHHIDSVHARRPPPPSRHFDPKALADELHTAGNSLNKSAAIDILVRWPPNEVSQIAAAFYAKYKESAEHFVGDRFGGIDRHCRGVLEACATGVLEYDAQVLYRALRARPVEEAPIIEILAGRTPDDIRALRQQFRTLFHQDLDTEIYHRLTGHFKNLMETIVQVERRSTGPFDVNIDAETLYKAGEARVGKDEFAFIRILADRPDEHLRLVFDAYHRRFGKPLEQAVKNEFGGEVEKTLILLIRSARDRADAIVELFEEALKVHDIPNFLDKMMSGSGADDDKLIRLTVRHRAPGVRDVIKQAYLNKYNKALTLRMKEEIKSRDYLEALLACMGEH